MTKKRKVGKAKWKEQGRFRCTHKPKDKNAVWMNAEINPMELLHKVEDVYTLKNKLRQWQIFLNKISQETEVHEDRDGAILTVHVLEQDIEKYKKLGFEVDEEII